MPLPPAVWIIEQDHWPRANLRAELIERGYGAVGFESVGDAVAALRVPGRRRPEVVVVDLAGQEGREEQLAIFERLGSRLLGIGGAVELGGPAARGLNWSELLRRPVSLGDVADVVDAQQARGGPTRR
jgi:hypothetical protein